MVTLETLRRASAFVSVSAVARAGGMDRQTLHSRLRRGAPELTAEESAAIVAALRGAGVSIGRPRPSPA